MATWRTVYANHASVWCSEDRKAAFDQAIQGLPVQAAQCKNPVRDQYQLGLNMGVNGTPAIYNSGGTDDINVDK
jgi:thiol:disulfide interchange protein DsbC